jgi:hypothetical protein
MDTCVVKASKKTVMYNDTASKNCDQSMVQPGTYRKQKNQGALGKTRLATPWRYSQYSLLGTTIFDYKISPTVQILDISHSYRATHSTSQPVEDYSTKVQDKNDNG